MMKVLLTAAFVICVLGVALGIVWTLSPAAVVLREHPGTTYQVQRLIVTEFNTVNGDRCVATQYAVTCRWED